MPPTDTDSKQLDRIACGRDSLQRENAAVPGTAAGPAPAETQILRRLCQKRPTRAPSAPKGKARDTLYNKENRNLSVVFSESSCSQC